MPGLKCRNPRTFPLIVTALALVLLSRAQAQQGTLVKDFLPADTITYLEIPSLSGVMKGLEQHPIALLLKDKEMNTFMNSSLAMAEGIAEGYLESNLGVTLKEVLDLLTGRLEFAWVSLDSRSGKPLPVMVLAVEVGDQEAKAREVLQGLMKLAEKDGVEVTRVKLGEVEAFQLGEPKFHAFFIRGGFYLVSDRTFAEKIIAGIPQGENCLKNNEDFNTVLSKVNARTSHGFFFYNFQEFFKEIFAAMPADEPERETSQKILDKVGINGLKSIGGSLTFGPLGVREILHMHMPGERKGLLGILDTMKPGLTLPARLDGRTVFYYGGKLDFLASYDILVDFLGDVLEEVEPSGLDKLDEFLNKVESGSMGFKLREDVLASLGDEFALSMGLPRPGGFIPDVLLTLKLKNAARINALLDKVEDLVPGEEVIVTRLKVGDTPLFVFKIGGSPVSPALAVMGDTLVVGAFARSVKNYARGCRETLDQNEVYRSALASVGLQNTSSIAGAAYLDVRSALEWVYDNLAPMLSSLDLEDLPFEIDLALLPTTEALVKPFKPFISVSRIDQVGAVSETVGPLPFTAIQMLSMAPYIFLASGRKAETDWAPPGKKVKAKIDEEVIVEEEPVEKGERGSLGIEVEDLDKGAGCKVLKVDDAGAGQAAGVRVGDIIVALDGKSVADVDAVVDLLARKSAGNLVLLKLKRGEDHVLVSAVLKAKQ